MKFLEVCENWRSFAKFLVKKCLRQKSEQLASENGIKNDVSTE